MSKKYSTLTEAESREPEQKPGNSSKKPPISPKTAEIPDKIAEICEKSPKSPENPLPKVHSSENFIKTPISSKKPRPMSGNLVENPHKSSENPRKSLENPRNFTQTEIFYQACLERKKLSFSSLRNWDLKRAKFLTLHRNILETIQERLLKRVKNSQDFTEKLIKYLRSRALQERNYASFPEGVAEFEEEVPVFGEFAQKLRISAQLHGEQCERASFFAEIIEKNLLEEQLLQEKASYDAFLGKQLANLIKIKKNLTKMNIEASEKSAKYSTLYFTMVNAPFGKKHDKDLYRRQVSFLRSAKEQVTFQRKLAVETFEFWEKLKEIEINRARVCEEVVGTFIREFRRAYPFLKENEEKTRETHEISQENQENARNSEENKGNAEEKHENLPEFQRNPAVFELELGNILKEEEISAIIAHANEFQINLSALAQSELKSFFEEFVIKPNKDDVLLIMKEAKAQRNIGGLLTNYVECRLILTVDGFLLCFDAPSLENHYKKPSMIVNLETTSAIKVKEQWFLEISRTKPGFLMNTLEKFTFKFAKKDELDELIEYLNRYYIKK